MKKIRYIVNLLAPFCICLFISMLYSEIIQRLNGYNIVSEILFAQVGLIAGIIFVVSNSVVSLYRSEDRSISIKNCLLSFGLTCLSFTLPILLSVHLSYEQFIGLFFLYGLPAFLGSLLSHWMIIIEFPTNKRLYLLIAFCFIFIFLLAYWQFSTPKYLY